MIFKLITWYLMFKTLGIALYDMMGNVTKDPERGLEYPAWTVIKHEAVEEKVYQELADRTLSLSAQPLIFAISASAKINNDIAVAMRDKLKRGMISFLITEMGADEYLTKTNKDELINEMVSLSMELVNGNIKLKEPSGGRKDRYTSVSYMNYIASYLDNNILKERNSNNVDSILECCAY